LQAAQALEPAALVPLQLLAPGGHVVLVGDPKQLPPTVLSRAAEASNLAQSLFERLQQVGLMVSDLDSGIFQVIPKSSLECY
jgi:superfamily I DNA and/or RNA helicase